MTDMPTSIGRMGNHSIATTQIAHGNGCICSVSTNWTHICLLGIKEVANLAMRHPLDLINIARSLIVPIDFLTLIGMAFSIASHKVRVLYLAHDSAWSVLTGNQVDRLGLSPCLSLCQNILDIAYIDGHRSFSSANDKSFPAY